MFLLLLPCSNLQGKDPFLLDSLHLGDDVVIQPKDRDRNPSVPLVPQRCHSALDGDGSCPPRVGAHHRGLRLDDPAAGLVVASVVEGLRAEAPVEGKRYPRARREKAEAADKASGGGGHGGARR